MLKSSEQGKGKMNSEPQRYIFFYFAVSFGAVSLTSIGICVSAYSVSLQDEVSSRITADGKFKVSQDEKQQTYSQANSSKHTLIHPESGSTAIRKTAKLLII